ncbi:MAG: hypothetical protein JO060_08910, partial [Candidatus Eremiobacteraeota bacterium]|nr:hypothetical protein [Candidatus Eremiobacteraeota bacterium]
MEQRSSPASTIADLTAGLQPVEGATAADLDEARAALARSLIAGRDPASLGDALHVPFVAGPGAASDVISPIVEGVLGEKAPSTPPPLAYLRDLPAAEGLSRVTPAWANGMSSSQARGPFVDAAGVQRWINLIPVVKTLSFLRAPANTPLCLLQIRVPFKTPGPPTVTGTLGAGSLWLVVEAFDQTAPADAFAGLAFSSGKVTISGPFTVTNDVVTLAAGTTMSLEVTPVLAPAPASGTGAGGDFRNSSMTLPASVTFTFDSAKNTLSAMNAASVSAYGSAYALTQENAPPVYNAPLALLAFPCNVAPSAFAVTAHSSTIFALDGQADIAGGAYDLPVALTTPAQLGAAASGGYLSFGVTGGLFASIDKAASATPFNGAIILRTPTTLIVFANTASAKVQRYDLWDGRNTRASSLEAAVPFGATIAFVSASGLEFTVEAAAIVALLDRPVAATGSALPITFPSGLVAVVLSAAPSTLIVFAAKPAVAGEFPLALENAYLAVGQPTVLELVGRLQGKRVTSGGLGVVMPLARVLPTLPDPYLAVYVQRNAQVPGAVAATSAFATVLWPSPANATLAFTLLQQSQAAPLSPPPASLTNATLARASASGFAELLDVSTNADLLGVFLLQISGQLGFDGIALATLLDRVLLLAVPQISWEPLLTPNTDWGFISQDDGNAAFMLVQSTQLVHIEPSILFDADIASAAGASARAGFTLPFGIEASVDTTVSGGANPPLPSFTAMRPTFTGKQGGRQLAITAGNIGAVVDAALPGSSDANAYGVSVLGDGPSGVGTFYNEQFNPAPTGKAPRVPVSRYDLCGYGASLFSDWFETAADPAVGIATARFEVSVGRAIYEVVQAKSYIYPWAIPVVETVT